MTVMRTLTLLLLLLALAGCAGLERSGRGDGQVDAGDLADLPRVSLPGARLQEARSVAMAAARTKGWTILTADANRLVLERQLPPDAPQAQALGSVLAPPRIQVVTDIAERSDGTVVALRAFVLSNPGTPEERRIDYTADYESQLLISLSALTSSWIAARDKLRSQVPVLATTEADATDTDAVGDLGDAATTVSAGAAQAAVAARPAPTSAPEAADARARTGRASPETGQTTPPAIDDWRGGDARGAMAQRAVTGVDGAVTGPSPIAPTAPADSGAPNEMLVLNRQGRTGLWAYYAEDFARLRGCALGGRGAVLLQETDGFEVHEVECVGRNNLLVKCRGGVCEPMR
ncbi:hypothetical protein [uncultured Thiohalocapsa sp.]|uniref:hypothetical protein n=1 Tax=uncultured Thiohalocapsa sp. TaxID=768990 RepID=UPI0025D03924|nr:hypothetical protein [uncultured Thiohalocapsa sp.]